ncbi:hypothetical protein H6F86_00125 [Phormidium sp. FACHB-592]|uniref:Uncharacterized protein n=1 Tax=Stenomitos frigidus AS-A4 TaxID=2933935 RepID=A0ABV0KU39_9CYAN|nr:hypothetical protein [Phormidium sp. FACHB-592]MBD2072340.1 hypothetical protein [Phormidium sp. FACHB-592]
MNKFQKKLYGRLLKNLKTYREFEEIGFDYILNPATQELHRIGLDNFFGSHNLKFANLENFIGISNIGVIEIHTVPDGVAIPIYDLETGNLMGDYIINKCCHCFT